jgi:hypothetical protein
MKPIYQRNTDTRQPKTLLYPSIGSQILDCKALRRNLNLCSVLQVIHKVSDKVII